MEGAWLWTQMSEVENWTKTGLFCARVKKNSVQAYGLLGPPVQANTAIIFCEQPRAQHTGEKSPFNRDKKPVRHSIAWVTREATL